MDCILWKCHVCVEMSESYFIVWLDCTKVYNTWILCDRSVFGTRKYVVEEEIIEEEVCDSPPRKKLATDSDKSTSSSISEPSTTKVIQHCKLI